MTTFEKYFNKSEQEVTEQAKALTLKKVKRGFESAFDQIEEDVLEYDVKVEKDRVQVAQGNVQDIDKLLNHLHSIEQLKEYKVLLAKEQKEFVG